MSYIATDFDNLNAGINILNLTDTETNLLPYEGTYSDKGKGYKQQYLTYSSGLLEMPHLIMDFCFIFKDGFTTSNVTYLSLIYDDVLDFVTPTTTADSDGNVVWLFENVDTWDFNAPLGYDFVYFQWNKGNEDFYYYIASNYAIDNKQPDDFDIVRFFSTRPNVTFEAHRSSPTSNVIEMTFDGSFYNGSLGLVNNTLQSIEVYHYDDLYNKITDKLLVQNTDFTIDGNRIYSGTLSNPSVISITTGILYNQAKNIFLEVRTTADREYFLYMITKGIPVCNWKEGEFYINGDLIVCDTDGNNPVNVLQMLQWKYLGSKTGNASIDLPSSFNELYCDVAIYDGANTHIGIVIPYQALSSSSIGFNGGYYQGSSTYAHTRILATTTAANCSIANLNGTNRLTSTTTNFYYR